jgi:NitT/TauT family transport system permease protein
VKVAVMIEVLASVGGIGNELSKARQYMDAAQALAWVGIAVAGLIVLEYGLVHPLRAETERWREAARPWGVKR